MKNKKFLLTIAMIMSLVMAVSCGDTPADPGKDGNPGGPSGAQPTLKISFTGDGASKTQLADFIVGTATSGAPTGTGVTTGKTLTLTLEPSTATDTEYAIETVERLTDISASGGTLADAGYNGKKNSFTITKTSATSITIKVNNSSNNLGAGWGDSKVDYYKITIKGTSATSKLEGTFEVFARLKSA